jgi:4-diphosphocytidyl-2-C-methyl-D-erythritol kinase
LITSSENTSSITITSHAKVNLYLDVLGLRPDGYHEIETLIQEISLHDTLTFTRTSRGISVECDDPRVPCDASNLVWRAAARLKRGYPGHGGIHIRIEKRIPPGGGLGGGSSNAAAALKALNGLWQIGLGVDELESLGARIGSDVPFFIRGGAAICRGRGEVVQPVRLRERYWYVLALPGFAVSTRQAYANLRMPRKHRRDLKRSRMTLTTGRRRARLHDGFVGEKRAVEGFVMPYNRLERPVFRMHPALRRLRDALADRCPRGALLSGSGSTLFGICDTRKEADNAGRQLDRKIGAKIMVVYGRH